HGLLFEARGYRDKHQHAGVARVPEIARGTVGNKGGLVVAGEIVAVLKLAIHRPNHGEAHAIDLYSLADRGMSAEQLLAQARAEKDQAAEFDMLFRSYPPTLAGKFNSILAIFCAAS